MWISFVEGLLQFGEYIKIKMQLKGVSSHQIFYSYRWVNYKKAFLIFH